MGSGNAAADDDDFRRRHARHAADKNAGAAVCDVQEISADMDAHAPRHFAHGSEKGKTAAVGCDGFIGYRNAA